MIAQHLPVRVPVRPVALGLAVLTASLLSACSSDSPTEPGPSFSDAITEVQVDASTSTAYIQLGDTIRAVSPSNPASSTDWDLAVFATSIEVNSGPAGPGAVSGYCLCENEAVSNANIQLLTAAGELPAFAAITSARIPADGQFVSEALLPRITGWYTGTGASAQANAARTFVVLRTRVTPVPLYGKFHVTGITGATATSPGTVTFEYAMQATSNGVLPDARSATVTVGSAPVYFDLASGAVSSAAGTWDIQFDGFVIRSNSGASGGAGHLVAPPMDVPFASLDRAALYALPNSGFDQDATGGPFGSHPWYKYNVTGTDQQIWPNFNTYLVKKGAAVFKLQVTSYYNATGQSRRITIRSARLK